jgi:hypothetical protein
MDDGVLDELFDAFRTIVGLTVEQRLARLLRRIGPFVAIGRPGEELPELGAARMYVSDNDWQQVVGDFLEKTQLVVLQVAESPGLIWEMEAVGRRMEAERVLLFLPFDPRRDWRKKRRHEAYQVMRKLAESALPTELPESIGDSCFLYFTTAPPGSESPRWVAHVLERWLPVVEAHPYSALLRCFARSRAFRRPGKIGWLEVLLLISLICLVIFIVYAAASLLRSIPESFVPSRLRRSR